MKVSVVVCTYNREKYLPDCLAHLKDQSADISDYEVLIVNNNSTDATEQISLAFIEQHNTANFRYILETSQGLSFARNRGINEAQGHIISFIDDDAFSDKNFVKEMLSFFEQNGDVMAIGGRIIPIYESEEPKWMSKYLSTLVAALDMGEAVTPFKGNKFPIGANMAFRKETFDNLGQFNTELGRKGKLLLGGEEKEVFEKFRKSGFKVMYVPNILVHHIVPASRVTIDYIKRQAVGVGISEYFRLRKLGGQAIFRKALSELFKMAATIVLMIRYFAVFQFARGNMLFRFRLWVLRGFIRHE